MQNPSIFRKAALERMSSPERLDTLMHITSPRGWLVLLALGILVITALAWATLVQIPVTVNTTGSITDSAGEAQLSVPASQARNIQPGMEVLLSPDDTPPQEYGYLVGEVVRVGEVETDGESAQVTIWVTLQTDDDGLQWTIGDGPDTLRAGMPCTADIIIEKERPITRIFPFLGS